MGNNMCFARRQYCVCSVLLVKECGGFRCAFYKTQEQFKADFSQNCLQKQSVFTVNYTPFFGFLQRVGKLDGKGRRMRGRELI